MFGSSASGRTPRTTRAKNGKPATAKPRTNNGSDNQNEMPIVRRHARLASARGGYVRPAPEIHVHMPEERQRCGNRRACGLVAGGLRETGRRGGRSQDIGSIGRT